MRRALTSAPRLLSPVSGWRPLCSRIASLAARPTTAPALCRRGRRGYLGGPSSEAAERGSFSVMRLHEYREREVRQTTARQLLTLLLAEVQAVDSKADATPHETDATQTIRLRDIRRLEFHYGIQNQPAVYARRHAIVFIMDPVRAIILADQMVLVIPESGDTMLQQSIENNVLGWSAENKQYHYTYEDNVIEALLTTVITFENAEFRSLYDKAHSLLASLSAGGAGMSQEARGEGELLGLKDRLSKIIARQAANKQAIADLLDSEEAMALMNLTKLHVKPALYRTPLAQEILSKHEGTEALIELYLLDFSALETRARQLQDKIDAAEALVLLRLDTARNELLTANAYLTILSCAIATGTYITGVFSMNIDMSELTSKVHDLFLLVTGTSLAAILLLGLGFVSFLEHKHVIRFRTLSASYLVALCVTIYALVCYRLWGKDIKTLDWLFGSF